MLIAHNGLSTIFQSTLPARGATSPYDNANALGHEFQSTLPARGATRPRVYILMRGEISIHAPRTGSDIARFLHLYMLVQISIHAPRTGSDENCSR